MERPIESFPDGRYKYLRYTDPHFSIENGLLNELEISQLQEAVNILRQFKGLPQFEWLEEVSAKLNAGMLPHSQKPLIAFDSNKYLKGIEHLADLYAAIRYQKTLCITYRHFKAAEPYEVKFHPYFLKQFNNRWFAFGHCADTDLPILNLALDRICAIVP